MHSIERYLLKWILGALCLGGLVVALVIYLVTLEQMTEVYDADLRNVAEALGSYNHAGGSADRKSPPRFPIRADVADESEIVTIAWTIDGRRVYSSDSRVDIPFMNKEAFSKVWVGQEEWLVYTDVSPDGVAQAAQRASSRFETAVESAAKVLPPMGGLIVVVAGLIVFALRRGLKSVDKMAQFVAAQSATALAPITTLQVPKEIAPLVQAVNGLMERLAEALNTQRRFLADAAHELRSPVTALRLQMQLLKRVDSHASRARAITEIEAGIDRSQHLIEKLLQLARAEPDGQMAREEIVNLGELVRSTVVLLTIQAEHRNIDLGAGDTSDIFVQGNSDQLALLLSNLVENALKYIPLGGRVDVNACLQNGVPVLQVIDNGPGVLEEERERIFDRFYRGQSVQSNAGGALGSGLGLAIVRSIADRHNAIVSLHTPDDGEGLEVRVTFSVSS